MRRAASLACALTLTLAALPSGHADPIGAEHAVDLGGLTPAPGAQARPEVAAADDGSVLVVWRDERNGFQSQDVYATRVATDGHVLDPAGIAIAAGPVAQDNPAVAWAGTQFVVAWEDGASVRAGRVARDGSLLDPDGLAAGAARSEGLRFGA